MVRLMASNAARFEEISPGVFRTFKLQSDGGGKSFKTYKEAVDHVAIQEELWNSSIHGRMEYRIDMIDTTIISLDGEIMNEPPK